MRFLIVIASLLVAGGRFTVPGHGLSWPGTYEALAHLWAGALIVLAFRSRLALGALVLLSLLEVVLFLMR